MIQDFYSIGEDDRWRKAVKIPNEASVSPSPQETEHLITEDLRLENTEIETMANENDDVFRDDPLEDSRLEETLGDFPLSNQRSEHKGSAKEKTISSPPSSQQVREAMKRKWVTALEEIDSNDTYRLSKYRKLEEEKVKAARAAAEASESEMFMHYQSLHVTPLAAITGPKKCRNTHHDILALIVSVSADTIKRPGMALKRDIRVMDISTTKKVCLSVFVDAQNFVPEPGTVALFKHLTTHEFDAGSLNAFSKECEGKEWFIPDPPGFENGEVAQLRDCWARMQFSKQAVLDQEYPSQILESLGIPDEEDIADHLPPVSGKKHLTCYYWAKNGSCRYSDEECAYAHYNTGIVAHDPMHNQTVSASHTNKSTSKEVASGLPPSKSLTCYFWARNRKCNRSDEECSYAHYDTGTVARAPPGITVFDEPENVAPSIPLSKTLTCYFWARDRKCNRSDEECAYAHFDTGTVAHPPPQVVAASASTTPPSASTLSKVAASTRPTFASSGSGEGSFPSVKHLTCYFWANFGRCRRSDAECKYAHFHTGRMAVNPIELARKKKTP